VLVLPPAPPVFEPLDPPVFVPGLPPVLPPLEPPVSSSPPVPPPGVRIADVHPRPSKQNDASSSRVRMPAR
jgi:hypothetical protein